MNRTYTTGEAAGMLGVARVTVLQHIKIHGLGEKRGRDWFLSQRDIDFIHGRRGKGGRPRKDGRPK